MTRTLLVRGLLAGLGAGAAAFVVAYLFGQPPLSAAIALEETHHAAGPAEAELVSRGVQSTVGMLTALMVFGSALGGLFGIAYAVAQDRVLRTGPRTTALVMAGTGFATVSLVPFLAYPANPPAVGNPDTIAARTAAYVAMVVLSVLGAVVAASVARRLSRLSGWDRSLVGIGLYLALVAGFVAVLPRVDEVGPDVPASLLWSFRTSALATQAAVWAVLGLLFGALTDRAHARAGAPSPSADQPSGPSGRSTLVPG